MDILGKIESILFVASKPITLEKIAQVLQVDISKVEEAVDTLVSKFNHESSGIHILRVENAVQMGSNSFYTEIISSFIKDEIAGELTKAQLETLTVIAYRGPITRPEIEIIRGVNCAIILRNLMIRGLVLENISKEKIVPEYVLSLEALRHLGIDSPEKLPQYSELHAHEYVESALRDETEEDNL